MAVSIDWLVGSVVDWGNSSRDWGVGNWSMDSMGNSKWSMGNNWSSMDSMGNNWSSMGNNWGSMDSMGNNWSSMGNNWGSMNSMGNNWSSMGNNWSMISWGSVGNNWSSISWSSLVSWSWSLWVGSGSLIGDISNISIITIGGVGHSLDSAIRKSNSVGSLDIAGTI